MGGVEVVDGSTLSTTGEMQVTCNAPYKLSVNGVDWVPIASTDGVDTYLLSTGGVVRIFINGSRYFQFTNVIEDAFDFGALSVYMFSANGLIASHPRLNRYYQGPMVEGTIRNVLELYVDSVNPSMTGEELVALGGRSSQGDIEVSVHPSSSNIVQITVTNFDISVYNAVFLGNVLLAFFEPSE